MPLFSWETPEFGARFWLRLEATGHVGEKPITVEGVPRLC